MKETFRQSMAWLHTWTGLVVGWVLYLVFMTGTAGYFDEEITRWMQPEAPLAVASAPVPAAEAIARAQAILSARAPDAERWSIDPPWDRTEREWHLSWPKPGAEQAGRRGGGRERVTMDPATGDEITRKIEPRETDGGVGLYRLHYKLHYMPEHSAILIVGLCTMLMLLAILSGVVTHKKIFKDFFTFRPGKGQRSWLDMHNVISVTALPFFLMITYSGLVFFMYAYIPATMTLAYGVDKTWDNDGYGNPLNPRVNNRFDGDGAPRGGRFRRDDAVPASGIPAPLTDLPRLAREVERQWGAGKIGGISIDRPGDANARITFSLMESGLARNTRITRVFDGVTGADISSAPFRQGATWKAQNAMTALHEGLFAGRLLRWLYFLSGLLGCAMIATGLILWTVKRRHKQHRDGDAFSFRLVETLNIGTIAGLPLGIAAYFWANRLLPVAMETRAAWEYHSLFLAMGATLLWAAIRRPAGKAWEEALAAAALAFILLPVLNAITTNRHLGVTIPAGDWVLAGFDLTMLALGAVMAIAAAKVRRKWAAPSGRALRVHGKSFA
ncbi:PepSY-associated TM helix domain-containing protein [Sphingomonas colocasiae]|uniref:PepSY domain-containing protein n=1 Tax=Sphingomonas colocasiae TaxID=1848973 RepID=A0ABS7PNC1_9SPHN|nr:PepSY-associated TM helix domain-containing protein [Sphingomonas colocasiae]MBY8822802.1 PepSY domain-containing protein [Sphingomonas colocasiae]